MALGLLIGLVLFAAFFDFSIVNPHNFAWLTGIDQIQAYSAWGFYNRLPPSWSAGIPGYPIDGQMTVGQLDAIPVWSLFVRASGLLSGADQHFGLWLLICFMLQGLFAAVLANRWCHTRAGRLTATLLLAVPPWLLMRTDHLTLCAQWLPLASLLVFEPNQSSSSPFRIKIGQLAALFFPVMFASAIHPYLTAMTLLINVFWFMGAFVSLYKKCGTDRIKCLILTAMIALLNFGISLWIMKISGFFADPIDPPGKNELGYYTADALSFFNSCGLSGSFVPCLVPLRMGQYEGFSYLGAGGVLLVVASLMKRRGVGISQDLGWRLLTLAAASSWILALGEQVRFAGHWLINLHPIYQYLYPLLAPMRSIGRFVWVPACVVLLAAVRRIEGRFSTGVILATFSAALTLQALDLRRTQPIKSVLRPSESPEEVAFWQSAVEKKLAHMILVPPPWPRTPCVGDTNSAPRFEHYVTVALQHRFSINGAILGRPRSGAAQENCDHFMYKMQAGDLDQAAVYVVDPKVRDAFLSAAHGEWRCIPGVLDQSLCMVQLGSGTGAK